MTSRKNSKSAGQGAAKSNKRRFVRLDIFSPVNFATVIVEADRRVRLHPEKKAGILLNLSAGGVLLSTTDPASEGELVLMKFDIKGFDALTNVLGKVKRVEEREEGEKLIGVEFLSVENLPDPEIALGLSRLVGTPNEFNQILSRTISRYVFSRQVQSES